MSIERIDYDLCNGCGICISSCPMDVIRMDGKVEKAVIQYPEDCMLCGWCVIDCPQNAVYVSLTKASPPITCWG